MARSGVRQPLGPWEPYIRIIWKETGPLLNPILCNCVGYPGATPGNYYQFAQWIRDNQVNTDFFYTASPSTVGDLRYMRQLERLQRRAGDAGDFDERAATLQIEDLEQLAVATLMRNQADAIKLGLSAVSALYRLTGVYRPDTLDGKYLLWSAHELLREFRLGGKPSIVPVDEEGLRKFFAN